MSSTIFFIIICLILLFIAYKLRQEIIAFLQRLIGVLIKPKDTFENLERSPDWVTPLIVTTVATIIYSLIVLPVVKEERKTMIFNTIKEQLIEQMPNIDEERRDEIAGKQLDKALRTSTLVGVVSGSIGVVIWIFGTALILFVVGTFLGGKSSYIKTLSIVSYISLVFIPAYIVKIFLIIFNKSAYTFIGPAIFLSPAQYNSILYNFLIQFDLFVCWQVVLFIIGFSSAYKFTKLKSALAVGTMWAIWIIVVVVQSGLSG